ncbi:hypothetical protein, partial [Thiolapillus sp.]
MALLFCQMSGLPSPVLAGREQIPEIRTKPLQDAFKTLLPLTAFVDASWQFCSELSPQEKETLANAIRNWRLVNGMGAVGDLLNAASRKDIDLAALYQKEKTAQALKLQRNVGSKANAWCEQFPRLLASPKWQIIRHHAKQIALLGQLAKKLGKAAPLPPAHQLPSLPAPTFKQSQQAGIHPERRLIPDAFHCYREKDGNDYPWPDMIIQIPRQGEYRSSFGNGKYALERKRSTTMIKWQSGPFEGRRSSLRYDRYGQRFQLKARIQDQLHKFHCFQRGASDRFAQTSFRLRTPQPGKYRCNDLETGKQQILKLTPHRKYFFGSAQGSYRVENIIGRPGESSSKIIWISGPLAEEGKDKIARYSEEEGTGLRTLRINTTRNRFVMGTGGSSSKLSALCTAKGKPVTFQKYGPNKAPAPPKNAGGLQGFYYTMVDRFGYWEQESAGAPHYYTFFSDGYVYEGEPETEPGQTDCSRTLPNGEALCSLYFINQNHIRIGKEEPLPFKKSGQHLQIGDKLYQPVPRSSLTRLDGRFFHSSFSKWGTMDWGGSNYSKTIFTFTPDGHFNQQKGSQNTHAFDAGPTGMNIPGASLYGMGNSHDHNSGSYRIEGHTITFRYNDGREIRH